MFLMPGMVIALHTCGVLDSVLRCGERGRAGQAGRRAGGVRLAA